MKEEGDDCPYVLRSKNLYVPIEMLEKWKVEFSIVSYNIIEHLNNLSFIS
jgi:hypothetical protein